MSEKNRYLSPEGVLLCDKLRDLFADLPTDPAARVESICLIKMAFDSVAQSVAIDDASASDNQAS